jgi:hypothetical protein
MNVSCWYYPESVTATGMRITAFQAVRSLPGFHNPKPGIVKAVAYELDTSLVMHDSPLITV